MGLKWNDYMEIAEALDARHPDANRIGLETKDILKMVRDLPDFEDEPLPPSTDYADAILYAWMSLDIEPGELDSERFEDL